MNFLQNVAHDLLKRFGTDMHKVAVIFPNKRASLFLDRYLAEQSQTPIWSPAYITISQLFRDHSELTVDNQIALICRLYEVFKDIADFKNETLDNFYGWGQLLLADFDDLDKNMAPADKVFSLVSDLHALDNADYLTDKQKELLKRFFGTFSENPSSKMRAKFLTLWNNLFKIYSNYKETLRNNSLAYEGMLYRDVVEAGETDFSEYDTYCFVGFNMLQKCEQQLFTTLKDKALYYWDYSDFYTKDDHEAGHFLRQYLTIFKNALPEGSDKAPFLPNENDNENYNENENENENYNENENTITFISAPTENLQGRYVTKWLMEKDRWKEGEKTAIIMADERLLQTVIAALPEGIDKINITTGYPLSQTQAATIISVLLELQQEGHVIGSDKYRLRQVVNILKHPYSKYLYAEPETLLKNLRSNHRYYPSRQELSLSPGLSLIFKDIDTIEIHDVVNTDVNLKVITWLTEVIRHIAMQVNDDFESEALFRMFKVLQVLSNLISTGILQVDKVTLQRLLGQVINSTSIPFHGEPVEGIQIMGVLESRCLDFKHVLLLSCNEGNMPKSEGDSSFIPHSVRKAYELTTIEHKVGIYSYYFHRLLQRCPDTTITYNSSTEGMNTGEMSRFMLQIKVECGGIVQKSLSAGHSSSGIKPHDIVKTPEILQRVYHTLTSKAISPSSLAQYLRCQARYYYQNIIGLWDIDDDAEEIDNKAFGIVFHKAAELVLHELKDDAGIIRSGSLEALLKDNAHIERIVDQAFTEEVFKIKDKNERHPEYNGMQLINRNVIIRLLKNLIEYDARNSPFRVLKLEGSVYNKLSVTLADGKEHTVTIGGIIDRLDEFTDKQTGKKTIRVIDYKTGANPPGAIPSMEDVFKHEMVASNHADYFLQTMLYSHIVSNSSKINSEHLPVSPMLFFVQKMWQEKYNPVLTIKGIPEAGKKTAPTLNIDDIHEYDGEFVENLRKLIHEITDPSVPFKAQYDDKACSAFCPFIQLCKR